MVLFKHLDAVFIKKQKMTIPSLHGDQYSIEIGFCKWLLLLTSSSCISLAELYQI